MFNLEEKYLYNNDKGTFPPEKPRYSMTENVEYTLREMKSLIDRMLKFENRVKKDVADLSSQVSSDNVVFKDTIYNAWKVFEQELKNEVNLFESNVDATTKLFQSDLESNYSDLSENVNKQITDLETKFTELYNKFADNISQRIDTNNTTYTQAFNDYKTSLTTEVNGFELNVNEIVDTFTRSVNNSINTFKQTWEQIISDRLRVQDDKISDNEMYMKTNLSNTIQALVSDMHSSGEFSEIIQGEVFNDLTDKINHVTLNIKNFGVTGNGVTDDTLAIQSCLDYAHENNIKSVVFPQGNYLVSFIDSETVNTYQRGIALKLYSNIDYHFINCNILVKETNLGGYSVLHLKELENVKLLGKNFNIIGERETHINDSSIENGQNEQGFGIKIHTCKNVDLENINISNCWGDGVVVAYSSNVTMKNVICESNRRQGMSVISSSHLDIINSTFKNTNGTEPQSGVDLEPDDNSLANEFINFMNCIFDNNSGSGLLGVGNTRNVTVNNCYFSGNKYNIRFTNNDDSVKPEYITINNCNIINSIHSGIRLNNAKNVIIQHSKINETIRAIYSTSCDDIIVKHNDITIINNVEDGALFFSKAGGQILYNHLHDINIVGDDTKYSEVACIHANKPTKLNISDNTFINTTRGICVYTHENDNEVIIKNNIIDVTDNSMSGYAIMTYDIPNVLLAMNNANFTNDIDTQNAFMCRYGELAKVLYNTFVGANSKVNGYSFTSTTKHYKVEYAE